jgi:putative DNA-invertase from lambdoid prophage Rac
LRERVRSGLALAKARGKQLGRQYGQRPKADKLAPKVLELLKAGLSYRNIANEVKLSKNTVMAIVARSQTDLKMGKIYLDPKMGT